MKKFYGDDLLLDSPYAETIYAQVKDLPIIDYHCHLDQRKIAENAEFSDIGELWLSGDHYKWRAMRLCGVANFRHKRAALLRERRANIYRRE